MVILFLVLVGLNLLPKPPLPACWIKLRIKAAAGFLGGIQPFWVVLAFWFSHVSPCRFVTLL